LWERSLTANNGTSKSIAVRDRSCRKSQSWAYFYFFFFWLGILGVAGRRLGASKVPRQLSLPHQHGYSALSFLV
jgi:hypothetical protein